MEVGDWMLHERYAPLVPRERIIEIDERIDVTGKILLVLNDSSARGVLRVWAASDLEAVAICTLRATMNPAHELRLAELVREVLPDVFITLSHQISLVVGECARMATAAVNAMLLGNPHSALIGMQHG